MSTPLDRLRKAIDNITIQYKPTDYLSKTSPTAFQYEQNMGCCCHCSETTQTQTVPDKTTYYTEEQLKKVVDLYEKEQCKVINLQEKHRQELSNLNEELERYRQDNKRFMDEKQVLLLKLTENVKVQERLASPTKGILQKERYHREEIDRLNAILQELNKQINEERQKKRHSSQKIFQLEGQLQRLRDINKRIEDSYRKQMNEMRVQNEQLKKMIDYQILTKSKEINQLHDQYENKLKDKDYTIQDLEKYILQLESNLTAQKDISFKLGQAIKNYEITMLNLNRSDQQRTQQKEQMRKDLTARINDLVLQVDRLAHIQRRNIQLEEQLETEKGRDKYHIVEVKDTSKDIELEVVRRQIKDLVQQKALFEARLKKMCKCKSAANLQFKHTLVEYDNKPKLEEYMKTHEVILRRNP